MGTLDRVRETVLDYLANETEFALIDEDDGRVACLTPLVYPSGDGVVVWVHGQGPAIEVTDYGEGHSTLLTHPPQDRRVLTETTLAIARDWGLIFEAGAVLSRTTPDAVGEAVWRVASASTQIAHAGVYSSPRRRHKPHDFERAVEKEFKSRGLPVKRGTKLTGQSGHPHRATIFLPNSDSVLEPLGSAGHWSQVSAIYAKFGDLSRANGYRLLSVIDDREGRPPDDIVNLLVQVSDVVEWSRRASWLEEVT